MSETTVLKSSASPKNASPHMAGGKNHVQIAPKPMVNVTMANGGPIQQSQKDKNVVLGKPTRAIAVRASAPNRPQAQAQAQRQIDDGGVPNGGGGGGAVPGAAKPMISVRMDGGKPRADDNRTNGGNRGNVVLLNRGGGAANRPIPRRPSANARSGQAALPAAAPVASSLSADQLMCCRHAVNQYLKSDQVNDMTSDLAKSTLAALDRELEARSNEPEPAIEDSVTAPARRQVTVGGGSRAGVSAPRRFGPPTINAQVRRVVPAPVAIAMVDDVSDAPRDEPSEDTDDGGGASDVIDIEPTE